MRIATYNPDKGTVTWHDGKTGEAMLRYYGVDHVTVPETYVAEVVIHTHYGESVISDEPKTTIRLPDTILVTGVDY